MGWGSANDMTGKEMGEVKEVRKVKEDKRDAERERELPGACGLGLVCTGERHELLPKQELERKSEQRSPSARDARSGCASLSMRNTRENSRK